MAFHLPVVSSRDLHRDDSDDDEEETLSLCEFSINSSSDSQNSSFKSSSTEDEDSSCFEFFSEEWSTTLTDDHRQNSSSSTRSNVNSNTIIFCGKLIPSKEPVSRKIQKTDNIKSTSSKQNLAPLFTSSAPSKWYLFFFGITKFRTKMELRDIKVRQSRSRRSSSFHSACSADNEIMSSTCTAKNKGGGVCGALLRTLSCGSAGDHRAADVMVRPLSTGSILKPSGVKSISRFLCMG